MPDRFSPEVSHLALLSFFSKESLSHFLPICCR
nr:MAG TPA: hypothetical protein [Caudoviricetes sp.]